MRGRTMTSSPPSLLSQWLHMRNERERELLGLYVDVYRAAMLSVAGADKAGLNRVSDAIGAIAIRIADSFGEELRELRKVGE